MPQGRMVPRAAPPPSPCRARKTSFSGPPAPLCAPLALGIEQAWPKERILEVYLNIAEWGPGIFGAEAAAQRHFRKPASRLTEREAALLAATLPNPILRNPGRPSRGVSRIAGVVERRARLVGTRAACVLGR